ncbi:hypothetical protein [Oceaniglobus trochenteri]|uniref:hypothetical protein n=1 Tax=Oceaniglobus trochenteri TaxID=2763260 RepID=UPI001D001482|nr:hypothetical protein [Oceaniglobus trochenteri]
MLVHVRTALLALISAFALSACGGLPFAPKDAPVQGLAAEQAGLDADGMPLAPDEGAAPEARPDGATGEAETGDTETAPEQTAAVEPEPQGFFGRLFGGGRAGAQGGAATGLFGAANAAPGPGALAPEVAKNTVVPFGEVATVCGLSKGDLGDAVAQSPAEGRARWQLHDPIPASTGPRTQYVTGFRDRCARQVTGALVLFGSADVHEATRYDSANTRPYSATDTAYEKVKSRLCGVRPNVPCPADRLERLNSEVSFVTVYPQFGATSEWFELLLVDGQLGASAMSGQ